MISKHKKATGIYHFRYNFTIRSRRGDKSELRKFIPHSLDKLIPYSLDKIIPYSLDKLIPYSLV